MVWFEVKPFFNFTENCCSLPTLNDNRTSETVKLERD